MVILENHANLAAQKRNFTVFRTRDVMAAKPDFPGAGPLNPTDQLQEGTFPCAGMTIRQLCSHEQRACEYRTARRTGALQRLYAGFKGECTAR